MKSVLILIIVIVALAICSYIYIYNPSEGLVNSNDATTPLNMYSTTAPPTSTPIDPKTIYDKDNYNVIYHTDPSNINYESSSGPPSTWVMKDDGKLHSIPYSDNSGNHLYYEPGAYRFGPSSYIPNYEESIYLSKLTKLTNTSTYNSESSSRGFCEQYKDYPDKLEEMCRTMPADSCGSTNCCTLLGGVRCTYGDANGPKIKSIYSDQLIANKDFYYYQGKCYGNCNQTP